MPGRSAKRTGPVPAGGEELTALGEGLTGRDLRKGPPGRPRKAQAKTVLCPPDSQLAPGACRQVHPDAAALLAEGVRDQRYLEAAGGEAGGLNDKCKSYAGGPLGVEEPIFGHVVRADAIRYKEE